MRRAMALTPLLGDKVNGPIGKAIDCIAALRSKIKIRGQKIFLMEDSKLNWLFGTILNSESKDFKIHQL